MRKILEIIIFIIILIVLFKILKWLVIIGLIGGAIYFVWKYLKGDKNLD